MTEPKWLEIARADLGVAEIAGPNANPRIMAYYRAAGADWAKDDAVPWCGAAMAAWVSIAGHAPPAESARARAWLDWGVPLEKPKPGAVVILQRGSDPKSGHVTLYLEDRGDRIACLGGNQGDAVSITAFPKRDVIGYRWPHGAPEPAPERKMVVVPDKPLRRSTTIWSGVAGLGATATAWSAEVVHAGMEWAATLTSLGPLRSAMTELGANARSIALGLGVSAGVMVLSARAKAKERGLSA